MLRIVTPLAALFLIAAAPASAERVGNFQLLDQYGKAHELYYMRDASAIVLMVQGNGCPIVRNALPTLEKIRDDYAGKGVEFLLINSNLQDTRESILKETREFDIDFPILDDETQLIGESLGIVRTAEVFVIDPSSWEVRYRGPIDDRLTYEKQKAEADAHYLRDALDAVIAGEPVAMAKRDAVGCLINFPARNADFGSISYSDTIAPLLMDNCVTCHRPRGIGPWAMTSYTMVRGFAPMIREVLRTDRMPPWHADPHIGSFIGDRSLTTEEIRTLVHWVEAGAPRGEGPDPLTTLPKQYPEWPLGEPDLVVTLPAVEVPATGVVDYQFPSVANPLDEGVWVRAAAIKPGDRSVVHHVLAGSVSEIPDEARQDSVFENYLIGYAPGAESWTFPEGTGVYVPPGGAFAFQVHYTPTGRAATDVTKMALYFYDEPPTYVMRNHVIADPTISIPAGDPSHPESAYLKFPRDAIVYSLFPHAHYRGKSSSFVLRYPDGREETLLSLPEYDFNWQREYAFTEPLAVPAGSMLIHRTVYDNSPQNLANPDPTRTVPWGLQSWDEMLYGHVVFRWREGTAEHPVHNAELMQLARMYGFMDADMNSRLEPDEMPERMRERFGDGFAQADGNGDGGLDMNEFMHANRERVSARD